MDKVKQAGQNSSNVYFLFCVYVHISDIFLVCYSQTHFKYSA